MSYQDPIITPPAFPVMMEAVVEIARAELAAVPWLGYMFPRAWDITAEENGKKFTYPGYYLGNAEYHDLMPNDHLKSYGFFRYTGPVTFSDDNFGAFIAQDVSIIIWFNLDRLDSELSAKERYSELLKADIVNVLNRTFVVDHIVSVYDDDVDTIFQGYTVSDANKVYLRHPYGALRFDVKMSANPQTICSDPLLNLTNGKLTINWQGTTIDPITGLPI
jgi:hypothetical protein